MLLIRAQVHLAPLATSNVFWPCVCQTRFRRNFQICFSGTPFSDLLLRYPIFRFASQVPHLQICFSYTPFSDLLLIYPISNLLLWFPYLLLRYPTSELSAASIVNRVHTCSPSQNCSHHAFPPPFSPSTWERNCCTSANKQSQKEIIIITSAPNNFCGISRSPKPSVHLHQSFHTQTWT